MARRSIFYSRPWIYKAGLRLIHGKNLDRRYRLIADRIGPGQSVLEPACGPALLPDYLPDPRLYSGFDINERFVAHAQKKGIDAVVGDARDPDCYRISDAVVLCDALHHIGPDEEKQVLEFSLNSALRRLIVCEPSKDDYCSSWPNRLPGGKKLMERYYDYIEKDGNNNARLANVRMRKELEEAMMEGFCVVPKGITRKLDCIAQDIIVTYTL
jgi:hypothetical protein